MPGRSVYTQPSYQTVLAAAAKIMGAVCPLQSLHLKAHLFGNCEVFVDQGFLGSGRRRRRAVALHMDDALLLQL